MDKRRRVRLPHRARLDGLPSRSVSAINVRHEEKLLFDHVHTWWRMKMGTDLRQPDAFSLLLQLALENPRADLPEGFEKKEVFVKRRV